METRLCSACKEQKPIQVFATMGAKRAGYRNSICTPCRTISNRRRREAEPDLVTKLRRRSRLKTQYGISVEQYGEILASQGNVCAICTSKEPGSRMKHFPIDHCHTTGVIRGLLCTKCNRGLGLFNDNTDRMERAVKYLKGDLSWL